MTEIVLPSHSPVFLSPDNPVKRAPRWGWRRRERAFFDSFESRALFYDCFWDETGADILLVGPPPGSLFRAYRAAEYRALPSGTKVTATYYPSLSTMTTRLSGIPYGTTRIVVEICSETHVLDVQQNLAGLFEDKAVLFTMSKNNPLAWIDAWARYHVNRHGINGVVLFDNGSTDYGLDDLADTLAGVEGLDVAAIFSWPYAYGAIDGAVIFNPYWTQFLQVSSMGLVLRRLGMKARAIANTDIDELIACPPETSILDILATTPSGLVSMEGQWIEATRLSGTAEADAHSAFGMRLSAPEERRCKARKWVLDPRRDWVRKLNVHPYMHWIENRPLKGKWTSPDVYFWHFKGINTRWKVDRTIEAEAPSLERDEAWLAVSELSRKP